MKLHTQSPKPGSRRSGRSSCIGILTRAVIRITATTRETSIARIRKYIRTSTSLFGFRFNYTRLSMHGYLEFSDPPEYYTYPLVFPVKEWPKRNDPSFIGIFFSKCRIRSIRVTDID